MTKIANTQELDRWIGFVRTQKFPLELSCNKWTKPRTDPQNNALWGVAYPALRDATGNDPNDMHEYFCGEWFGWVEFEVMGKKKVKPRRSTTKGYDGLKDVIPAEDFAKFYEFIQRRSAESGYYVPDPTGASS